MDTAFCEFARFETHGRTGSIDPNHAVYQHVKAQKSSMSTKSLASFEDSSRAVSSSESLYSSKFVVSFSVETLGMKGGGMLRDWTPSQLTRENQRCDLISFAPSLRQPSLRVRSGFRSFLTRSLALSEKSRVKLNRPANIF